MNAKAVRGVTLIELLVAIVVSFLVADMAAGVLLWVYRQSFGSHAGTDRLERHALLRETLFQKARQGRSLSLSRKEWQLVVRREESLDTLTLACLDTALTLGGKRITPRDSLVACEFSPVARRQNPSDDGWLTVGPEPLEPMSLDTLSFVRVFLVLRAPAAIGAPPPGLDTLDLRIPL